MKSLKSTISSFIILSIITVSVIIGILTMLNFYDIKITSVEHTQKQVLKQVNSEGLKLLKRIENIASFSIKKQNLSDEYLNDVLYLNSDISSIFILNKDGILVDFVGKNMDNIYKGFDYSNKNFYKKLNDEKLDYWSDVFLSSANNSPSISYSLKYKNKIIVIQLKLEELTNFITKFKNSDETHMIRMVDKNGVFIFNPDAQKLVTQRFNIKNSTVFEELIKNNKEFSIKSFKSIKRDLINLGMYSKIKKTGWTVIIRQNQSEVIDAIKSIAFIVFFIVIIFVTFALFFVFKIFNKIFDEFDYLQETTKDISDGDYNKKIKVSDFKEITSLIGSFEKMKKQIDKREKKLKAARNSFEYLLNSTMEAIVVHDSKKIYQVNDVALNLMKLDDKNQLVGKSLFDFISEKSIELVKEKIDIESSPYELELVNAENETFTALGQGKFITLNNKKFKISCFIDITELKNKDKLLSQQSKMVSMGEMIGNIAHQWRQPLSSISTAAGALKVEKEFGILDDKSLDNSLDMIIKNTKYLSKTIDDFRNFFKVDKDIERIDLNEIIERSLKLLESSIRNHYIKIEKRVGQNLFINGFANELTQAFINIINNSKDALKINNVENRVIFIDAYVSKNKVFVIIKDNAGGIKEDIKSKIFDPYFTTKHQSQGTGIGLYMTHQIIVEHMAGIIEVENIKFSYENEAYTGCQFKVIFNYMKNT
ncbi:ATP-binding protein [Malaciobacter marinus]|uniref:ATP-binding protein n=1 Tax=Malaciobacter marinus TaxID=505249 RepID=UPI003B005A0A